jgi:hypothetical protein
MHHKAAQCEVYMTVSSTLHPAATGLLLLLF